jgi:predicted TIM-barrel fold metal-dependent hydrolase
MRIEAMQMNDMILISVDDHLVEPADLFDRHSSVKYKDRMPKIVMSPTGEHVWTFDGMVIPNFGLNAVAGRRPEEYGFEPTGYSQIRKGCYDVDARVEDMNVNGVLGSLNFSSFLGLSGQTLVAAKDKDLAYVVCQVFNDWHIDQWCGKYPARFIPCALVPLWDPQQAADEVRRVVKKGCRAISFPPNPTITKLPSLQSPVWDPIWTVCNDEGVTVCLHISDPTGTTPSMDSPIDVFIANLAVSLYATAMDLTYSPILRKYKDLKFALSEGGIGWVPHFMQRADFTNSHHIWTGQNFGGKKPSEVFLEHVYTCFIDDPIGVKVRHEVGLRNMTWECDYPHSDSVWPHSPEKLWESLTGVPDNEINLITYENAMRAFHFDPFKHMPKEQCTVGALRAQAKHVDVSWLKTDGAGKPPSDHSGVITFGDVTKQLARVLPIPGLKELGSTD